MFTVHLTLDLLLGLVFFARASCFQLGLLLYNIAVEFCTTVLKENTLSTGALVMGMLKMKDATALRFSVLVPLSKMDHSSSRTGAFFPQFPVGVAESHSTHHTGHPCPVSL